MKCLLLLLGAIQCASGQLNLITDVPDVLSDAPPLLAAGPNGDLYIAGPSQVLRVDKDGRTVWKQSIPLASVAALARVPDGGLVVAGSTQGASFVIRIDAQGNSIQAFPLQGSPSAITTDAVGAIYVAGTAVDSFVGTPGAYKTEKSKFICSSRNLVAGPDCDDAFVSKLRADGMLLWSSLLGGTSNDTAQAIAVDAQGNVWVGGRTSSDDYPTTADAIQRKPQGGAAPASLNIGDGFLAQFDPNGKSLLYSTYVGGTKSDQVRAIVSSGGGVVATGETFSPDFPVTSDARQLRLNEDPNAASGFSADAFIVQLDRSNRRLYATFSGPKGWRIPARPPAPLVTARWGSPQPFR
jgi:hypothetical protein